MPACGETKGRSAQPQREASNVRHYRMKQMSLDERGFKRRTQNDASSGFK